MKKTETLPSVLCVSPYIYILKNTDAFNSLFGADFYFYWLLKLENAIAKFAKHEGSSCHKDSELKTLLLPATTSDVGEVLVSNILCKGETTKVMFAKAGIINC